MINEMSRVNVPNPYYKCVKCKKVSVQLGIFATATATMDLMELPLLDDNVDLELLEEILKTTGWGICSRTQVVLT